MRKDWVCIKLGELFKTETGCTPSKKNPAYYGEGIPFVKPPDLWNREVKKTNDSITHLGATHARILPSGSVLVTCIGNLGRVGIINKESAFNQQINAIKPLEGIEPYFVFYQAQSPLFRQELEGLSSATTVAIVNKGNFNRISFSLPPLPEQRAIVAKLEALFSELDEGIESLQRAQDQLKVYRQAVLKKAFEGELTRAWREQQTDLPTAEELLTQIQAERERYYQQQLAEWEEAVRVWEVEGKVGKKPRMPKFIDFDSSLIMHHREPNWQTCALDLVTQSIFDGPFGSKLKTSDYVDEGIRVIRLENISNLQFKEEKTSFVTNEKYEEIARHTVYAGDIIFSSFISTEISVAIVPVSIPLAINKADCFCIRPHDIILRKYLVYFLASRFTYSQLVNIVHGATRPRINTTQLKGVEVPLCSLPEQHQIVQEIESRLSVCDQVEKDIEANLKRAERLRQSILQKSFAGELLTEAELAACRAEPDWEPAAVLLERIKKERK